jgi:hypothetical protein
LFATDKGLEKIGFRIIKFVNVKLEQTHVADVRLIVLCTLISTINAGILGTLTTSTISFEQELNKNESLESFCLFQLRGYFFHDEMVGGVSISR